MLADSMVMQVHQGPYPLHRAEPEQFLDIAILALRATLLSSMQPSPFMGKTRASLNITSIVAAF